MTKKGAIMATHHYLTRFNILAIIVALILLLIPMELNAYQKHWHTHPKVIMNPQTIIYYGPSYNNPNAYWTGWMPYYRWGYTCQKRCLINQYNGAIIQCTRRCY